MNLSDLVGRGPCLSSNFNYSNVNVVDIFLPYIVQVYEVSSISQSRTCKRTLTY